MVCGVGAIQTFWSTRVPGWFVGFGICCLSVGNWLGWLFLCGSCGLVQRRFSACACVVWGPRGRWVWVLGLIWCVFLFGWIGKFYWFSEFVDAWWLRCSLVCGFQVCSGLWLSGLFWVFPGYF